MAKETRLDENAEIYQPRDERSEKEIFKSLTPEQKKQQFISYYLVPLIVAILIIGAIISLIYNYFAPRQDLVFELAVVNDYIPQDKQETFQSEIENLFITNKDKQRILYDASYRIGDEYSSDYLSVEKLTTYMYAGEIDIIIADKNYFEQNVQNGVFLNLAQILPSDLYSELTDNFYCSKVENDDDECAYGINLSSSQKYMSLGGINKEPILGIVANSKNQENSVAFIEYLF